VTSIATVGVGESVGCGGGFSVVPCVGITLLLDPSSLLTGDGVSTVGSLIVCEKECMQVKSLNCGYNK